MQDQPVMGVQLVRVGDDGFETVFDVARRFPGREARAIADAKDVRVDRDRGFAEGYVHHHIRRLASDTGKLL